MNYYEMLLARKLNKGELPPNAYLLKEASGSLASFDDGADLPMPSFICNIDAVQDLHGQDAPWVGGAGKNKCDPTNITVFNSGKYFSTANYLTTPMISVKAGTQYVLSCRKGTPNTNWDYRIYYWDSNNTEISNEKENPFTTPSNCAKISFYCGVADGDFTDGDDVKAQLESGSTPTTYAPYENICPISGHTGVDAVISPTTEASAGTTYSVSWQTEAGEVFGGYVDLVSGVLVVTHKSQTSFTRGSQDSSNKLYNIGTISDIKAYTNASAISPYFVDSMFEKLSVQGARTAETPSITHYNKALYVGGYIGKEAELDTLLETLQVKYELETPITYQLTPTQIKSLLGNNNAWCNTGDVTVEYFGKGAE